jgi:hypothetical protein
MSTPDDSSSADPRPETPWSGAPTPPPADQAPQYGQQQYGQASPYAPPQYGQQAYDGAPYGAAYPPQGYYQQQTGYEQQPYGHPTYGQQPYTQQAMYAPPPGDFGGEPAKRSHAGALVVVILVIIVLAAAAVVLFYKPGYLKSTVFDTNAVDQGVTTILTNAPTDDPAGYGLDGISNVTCPSNVKVIAGDVFTCDLEMGSTPARVDVTIVDDSGVYKVGVPH